MPSVGERKSHNMGNFANNEMRAYAQAFCEAQENVLRESQVDYATEPQKALAFKGAVDQLKNFFMENCTVESEKQIGAEKYQDQVDMMNEVFINDLQAVRENAVAGMANWNPMIGLSLPMHKYLMLNCVFAQAVPRFVAKAPAWTETMETRYMITPDGKRIDIANQQNQIYPAWKEINKPVKVAIALPEMATVDILDEYFHVSRVDHNLSVATCITAVAVTDTYKTGDIYLKPTTENGVTTYTETVATANGTGLVWKPWRAEFNPGYGEYNRVITQPVDFILNDGTTVFHDTLFASQKDNMFEINSSGKIKLVQLTARYDASSRSLKTARVEWSEKTTYVQIPENDGITVPITPEEVKDIGALYGINQVTKYMSIIKDVLENVKDDDIKEHLDESFKRLDNEHKLAKTIDFAPRDGYYSDHLEWLQRTFMNTLDQFVTGLLTVLRDPNMEITVIGRPGIIRQITPVEYSYQTNPNIGPIELDFRKTVVTSDKRVYNFISSEKLFGSDSLIVLLNPKNTNRIVYRLYDYQMYISNEIRDADNPALPALTAFQRYKFFGYQEVQGRIFVANPTGLREHLATTPDQYVKETYTNNDLDQFRHYDPETGANVSTPDMEG